MPVIRAREHNPSNQAKLYVNAKGYYTPELTTKNARNAIYIFGANLGHFENPGKGGDNQAGGVLGCKNVLPIDTMFYADDESAKFNDVRKVMLDCHKRLLDAAEYCIIKTDFIFPTKILTQSDITKIKQGCDSDNQEARKWANELKVDDEIVNIGFGICKNPDIEVIYNAQCRMLFLERLHSIITSMQQYNTTSNTFYAPITNNIHIILLKNIVDAYKHTAKDFSDTVLPRVKVLLDNARNGLPFEVDKNVNTQYNAFLKVLKNLHKNNCELQYLTAKQVLEIFTQAAKKGYYTNHDPQLPLLSNSETDQSEKAKLMRQFSVAFQRECNTQGLNFSNTNKSGNKNGMRTKSALDLLGGEDNMKQTIDSVWK